jgi:hypothetical protein
MCWHWQKLEVEELRIKKSLTKKDCSWPVVIILWFSFGLDGPTGPCWDSKAGGSSLEAQNSPLILPANRSRVLDQNSLKNEDYMATCLLFSSFIPSSGTNAKTSQVPSKQWVKSWKSSCHHVSESFVMAEKVKSWYFGLLKVSKVGLLESGM